MNNRTNFTLRKQNGPTLIMPLICLFGIGLLAWISIGTHSWTPLVLSPILIGFAVMWVLFIQKYSITLLTDRIELKAAGGHVIMNISDITEIKHEFTQQQGRPLNRIVLYNSNITPPQYIDISLKHFVRKDIDELLAVIKEQRPDLSLP